MGTHRNMCTNLMSLFFLTTRGQLRFGQVPHRPRRRTRQMAYLLSVPLFHATGCHSVMVGSTGAGGKIVMMHHFDPARALELIEREQVTTFGGVPAMVMQVLDSPAFTKYDTSSVRSVSYGGAPAPPDLVRRIREAWPVGQPSNGYGLTETSSVTSMNTGADYVAKPDSVGPPVPVSDVADHPRGVYRRRAGGHAPPRPRGAGRTVDQGTTGGPRLLEPPGRDVPGLHPGLAPHRRHRPARRGELHLHRRSGQGHDHPRRRERLLGAGRGRPVRAPGRGRLRRDRRARTHAGRGGRRGRRPPSRPQGERRGALHARAPAPGRLHGAHPISGSRTIPSPATRRARCSSARLRELLAGSSSGTAARH